MFEGTFCARLGSCYAFPTDEWEEDPVSAEARHDLLNNSRGKLFGYAFALTGDAEQAADLLQDCLLRAMSSRNAPGDERAGRAWLFTMLRNLWIDKLRAQRRRNEVYAELSVTQNDTFAPAPEEVVLNRLAVRQAFVRLSKEHRDVLALVDIGGFSYAEAAEILEVPRGTVMSRTSRARLALSQMLAHEQVAVFPRERTRRA